MRAARRGRGAGAWRPGHRLRLLTGSARFYPAMLDAIGAARDEVLFEMYLVESGAVANRFVAALCAAAARGVRVCVLFDSLGARGFASGDAKRLQAAGVELCWFNPLRLSGWLANFARDHRKLLWVDGEVAFTGGAGLCDEYRYDRMDSRPWHDVMVATRGPCLSDWRARFTETWRDAGGEPLPDLPVPSVAAGGALARVVSSVGPREAAVRRSVVRHIRRARDRVWLATAYFMPSWKLRRALRRAVLHGADVRLLLPGPITDHPPVRHAGRRHYGRLLRQGVRIFEYQPAFLHAKLMLCDGWVSAGSSNMDRWTLRFNREANQEALDPSLAAEVAAFFEDGFAEAREITLATWRARPWHERLRERFWGVMDLWLERGSQRWWA